MTTTDYAADIRKTLKSRYGWTSRDVSVRADYYSMGSAIRIVIKNPAVSITAVEEVSNPAESIRRDHWGEILSGGNRYVTVTYDSSVFESLGKTYLPAVEAAIALRKESGDNSLIPVEGTPYMMGLNSNGWGLSVWETEKGHRVDTYDAKSAAEWIGVKMVPEPKAKAA